MPALSKLVAETRCSQNVSVKTAPSLKANGVTKNTEKPTMLGARGPCCVPSPQVL